MTKHIRDLERLLAVIARQADARLVELRKTNGGHVRASFDRGSQIEEAVQRILDEMERDDEDIEVPTDLQEQVKNILAEDSALRWDEAVAIIAGASEPKLSLDPDEKVTK